MRVLPSSQPNPSTAERIESDDRQVYLYDQVAVVNGREQRHFTSDTTRLCVEALAIKGGRTTAVGVTATIEQLVTPKTKRLNMGGMLLVSLQES